jgi:alpha-ketoglutarate-dependent taurine dioxygenase
MTSLSFEPISPTIGAYVHVAADDTTNEGVPEAILEALNRYNLLVFPQVNMSDEQFVKFTDRLGEQHALAASDDGSSTAEQGIYRIALDKDDKTQLDYVKGNDYWHMDGTVYDTPGKATLLKCEQPPSEGGDTGFASLHAAYDALPEERKRELEGKRVIHCLRAVGRRMYDDPTPEDYARWDAVFPPTEHPLVWRQKCGRTSMLIGSTAEGIAGMEDADAKAFLEELNAWATREEFSYRHHWQKGDLVIMNNPALLHRSYPYTEASGRLMHRTPVKGTEAIA